MFYEYLEVCQGDFENFDFSRNGNQFSADFGWFSAQNRKILRFFLASRMLVLRLGALENLKIGQVIDKIGLSKLYAAIFEIFIFWPVWADFRQKKGKICRNFLGNRPVRAKK